jgi:hypothetical protein
MIALELVDEGLEVEADTEYESSVPLSLAFLLDLPANAPESWADAATWSRRRAQRYAAIEKEAFGCKRDSVWR